MPALREADLATFLKLKSTASCGLLLFGNDDAAIQAALRQVMNAMTSDEEALRLDATSLRNDPARLDDAFRAMSLLGGRRLVIVSDIDENSLTHLTSVLDAKTPGNFVVLVAGSLKKDSKLKARAETSPLWGVVGLYEEGASQLEIRVQTKLKQLGLTCDPEAAARIVGLGGTDRGILESECEKLALFVYPEKHVSTAHVEASCGDQASYESDALCNAVLDGDADAADRIFASMQVSGDAKSVLIMLQFYLTRLETVSAALARGSDVMSACRMAKPPFFGAQQSTASRLVKTLSGDDLARAQSSVQQAMLHARQMGDLGDAITSRCLLSLARMSRHVRNRAAG
jgi:DNA polymerase III subunit delta